MLSTRDMVGDTTVELTRDMLEWVLSLFETLGDQAEALTLELRGNGLVVLNPETHHYEIVGMARLSPAMRHLR